ncbi:hypothetical protein ISS30_04240 [bacterium]|nr:hypothetical protein [bacterium]
MTRTITLSIAALFIIAITAFAQAGGCADCPAAANCLTADQPADSFEKAWQNYLVIFEPIRAAVTQGDYQQMKTRLPHLKDAAVELRDAKISPDQAEIYRKGIKNILNQTKALLKAAKSSDRAKIQDSFDILKDTVDHIEDMRVLYQEHQGK